MGRAKSTGLFALAGVIAGVLVWLLDTRAGLAVLAGAGLAGSLVVVTWMRAANRQSRKEYHEIRKALTDLESRLASGWRKEQRAAEGRLTTAVRDDLAALEKRLRAAYESESGELEKRLRVSGSGYLAALEKRLRAALKDPAEPA